MLGSGAGRGRGWLNLIKEQQNNSDDLRPGPLSSPGLSTGSDSESTQFSNANEYSDIIAKIKLLNLNDDGIKFNQKIKYIIENWDRDCLTPDDVENSIDALNQAALQDLDLATKLMHLLTSRTFLHQEIKEKNVRFLLIQRLQGNFEEREQLQQTNPNAFRTSVVMLGALYDKFRIGGKHYHLFVHPLISCLEMLLEAGQLADLKLFTIQLNLNGAPLRAKVPEKIAELLNKVRLILAEDQKITRECRLWLLLALEVAGNRFGLLPTEIHNFYQEQLGDAAMASFQGTHGVLSVQTAHNSKKLDSYQSSVNVLQVSESPVDHQPTINDFNSSGFISDTSQASSNAPNPNMPNPRKDNLSKPGGRPILGSGARLNKYRDNGESWRGHKKGGEGSWEDRPNRTSDKGWEHDDRFDTDYS